ncbi:type VI secretion protein, partial [Candidatus Magnetomorum sp. HK-1]
MPAATVGDMCMCVGPPDTIAMGSTGVLIGGKPAARMGDSTAHGGIISVGCPTVLIGETSSSAGKGSAGNSLNGDSDGDKSSPVAQAGISGDQFDLNPKYSKGILGEMNPIKVLPLLSAFRKAAQKGKALCEVCQKSEEVMNAEHKAMLDEGSSMKYRNLDQERSMRKNAA